MRIAARVAHTFTYTHARARFLRGDRLLCYWYTRAHTKHQVRRDARLHLRVRSVFLGASTPECGSSRLRIDMHQLNGNCIYTCAVHITFTHSSTHITRFTHQRGCTLARCTRRHALRLLSQDNCFICTFLALLSIKLYEYTNVCRYIIQNWKCAPKPIQHEFYMPQFPPQHATRPVELFSVVLSSRSARFHFAPCDDRQMRCGARRDECTFVSVAIRWAKTSVCANNSASARFRFN